MNQLKRRIQEEVVKPAEQVRRDSLYIAKVTYSAEKNNFCSITFIDKDGYRSNKDNVPVRIYNQSFSDWFPSLNELVNVEESDGNMSIVSKFEGGYGSNVRGGTELKQDIYTSSFGGTMSGMIF